MNTRQNLFYNVLLSVSGILIPLIVYPYVSRTLGVGNIGLINFVDSVINYFLVFSMMGIGIVGVREVAITKDNPNELNSVFSSLVGLNILFSSVVICALVLSLFLVPKFWDSRVLIIIGGVKLILNVFLIEWFFRGVQRFKYITLVTLSTKLIYVVSVFALVTNKESYIVFFSLTTGLIGINAFINWRYKRKFVSFYMDLVDMRRFLIPVLGYGAYGFLISMYTTFNVIYLGFTHGDSEVAYYTTAIKLYGVMIALFSAFTTVMLPKMSSLVASDKNHEFERMLKISFELLWTFAFPCVIIGEFYAPQLLFFLAGPGFEGALMPMRLLMPLVVIIGIEQILISQILMPLKNDKQVLLNSFIAAIISLIANLLIVDFMGSVGSSLVWLMAEMSVLLLSIYSVTRYKLDFYSNRVLVRHLVGSLPYVVICVSLSDVSNVFLQFSLLVSLSILYFLCFHLWFNKTEVIVSFFRNMKLILRRD
jgi:O-antigen/teichoic acid export membrane protein